MLMLHRSWQARRPCCCVLEPCDLAGASVTSTTIRMIPQTLRNAAWLTCVRSKRLKPLGRDPGSQVPGIGNHDMTDATVTAVLMEPDRRRPDCWLHQLPRVTESGLHVSPDHR